MKKHFLKLLCAALVAIASASCSNNDNNDTITEQTFTDFFEVSTDLSSSTVGYYQSLGYNLRLNYTTLTAEITISGLQLNDGTRYPTMTLSDIPWTVDRNGWKIAKTTMVTPSISGYANVPVFNYFEMSLMDRVVDDGQGGIYAPGVCFRMNIDNKYSITSSYTPQTLYGTTVSTDEDGESFTTGSTQYVLSFNTATRTANIILNNARFAAAMPMGLNMEFNNIPAYVNGSTLVFETEALTPMMNNTPFEAFPITNLKGHFNFAGDLEFEFVCTPRTSPKPYTVKVKCTYLDELVSDI